ncbi:LppP/LprE family lipoprotein [[Mycobacterium] wendilense]|uniref:LppP/LprE family lipoprotein n=1 Tax=[Mycobacterium] wendilense TaxID=3064284 RepID=A0ABN9NVS9_9MYCO|nr:LppP/LprE family lipoprotein [Mycolicibacterium sp. MU0050]CAJ1580777.1 LppP/LprE family lipoprotein [Mycolicibacterium sp. MU0050]
MSAARRATLAPAVAAVAIAALTACGSGDSTVAKTPAPPPAAQPNSTPAPSTVVVPTTTPSGPADPCAVNLAAPAIAQAVSELPRDPRSKQPWSTEPIAGNYNECAPLSAVIVEANTNAENPSTRALLFHLGRYIPTGVPDTFGFSGLDTSQSTGDTVALEHDTGIEGLSSVVKFRWNGSGVELIGNAPAG